MLKELSTTRLEDGLTMNRSKTKLDVIHYVRSLEGRLRRECEISVELATFYRGQR